MIGDGQYCRSYKVGVVWAKRCCRSQHLAPVDPDASSADATELHRIIHSVGVAVMAVTKQLLHSVSCRAQFIAVVFIAHFQNIPCAHSFYSISQSRPVPQGRNISAFNNPCQSTLSHCLYTCPTIVSGTDNSCPAFLTLVHSFLSSISSDLSR